MVNAVFAGAARHLVSNAMFCAEIDRVVPFGVHCPDDPLAGGGAAAAAPLSPSVGLYTIRYRIRPSPTTPTVVMAWLRPDRRIASNCSPVTACDPPAMARATNAARR